MARKLRTFQTSLGFHDLAIAAPSMKAALEAWGAGSNLFHQGIAREADDPEVIEAAMAKPGIVLKRPAGSHGRFSEHAAVPSRSAADDVADKPRRKAAKPDKQRSRKPSEEAARKAAASYEKEQARREAQRRREEEVSAKARERREQAVAEAQSALEEARHEHEARAAAIEAERAAVNARAEAEDERWMKQKAKLIDALRRARES
ncbi:cell envelope biogenesis protein TolA [Bradyrhizobium diazoefficiens]|nr:cell envelope biogenesis protein TolA [Bradyrhizobium diazoefficiens]MBR0849154.1 cell envelope biogenesis protein TolA [Bradyrhizobium diazoefficiens]